MKLRKLNIIGLLLPISVLFASCRDDDSPKSPDTADYSVVVEMSYIPKNSSQAVTEVQIAWLSPDSDDDADTGYDSATVQPHTSWAKTVTYNGIPELPVYMSVNPVIGGDVEKGTTIKLDYKYTCTVTLFKDGKTIDSKSISDNPELDFIYKGTTDMSLAKYVGFIVSPEGLQPASAGDVDENEPVIESKTIDEDVCRISGRVLCYSVSDVATNDVYLYDNMLARFSERVSWNGMPAQKSEFVFLYKNDIEKAPADVLKESLENGAIIIIDCLDSYSQFTGFCKSQGIFNPLGDEDRDVSHTMFIVANSSNGLAAPGNDKCRGIFYVLDPALEEDGTASDYEQGLMVDNAVNTINRIITPQPAKTAAMSRSPLDDLKEFMTAQIVGFSGKQTLPPSDFAGIFKNNKIGMTNVYGVEFDIWNAYRAKDDRNYFYIHQEFVGNFNPCYEGTNFVKDGASHMKYCGWYADHVYIRNTGGISREYMKIHQHSPQGAQSGDTYPSGLNLKLDGTVFVQGDKKPVKGTGGLSFSTTSNYNIAGVTVEDRTSADEEASWYFDFKGPKFKFHPFCKAGCTVTDGALLGRTTFTAGMDYIVSFPAELTWLDWETAVEVTLGMKYGYAAIETNVLHRRAFFHNIFRLESIQKADLSL